MLIINYLCFKDAKITHKIRKKIRKNLGLSRFFEQQLLKGWHKIPSNGTFPIRTPLSITESTFKHSKKHDSVFIIQPSKKK